jgi:hypothetical protein
MLVSVAVVPEGGKNKTGRMRYFNSRSRDKSNRGVWSKQAIWFYPKGYEEILEYFIWENGFF